MGRPVSILLNSCVLIDCLAGISAARAYIGAGGRHAISLITWMEVLVGATSSEDERIVRALLGAFEVLPNDQAVAEEAVRLRRARRLKLPDAIIFATARVHRRDLATRNTRDFAENETGVAIPYRISRSAPP